MYPEVRAAVGADAGPDVSAPGFDIAAHREDVRRFNLRQPREDVASVEDRVDEGDDREEAGVAECGDESEVRAGGVAVGGVRPGQA